ncbi:PREDICTED: uncharacterized protein LOC108661181 [Theobroma cacao]|uniref:Uncharacterized protein LOC108661181 n=1 Tax=Theobroma cacao TaxID=3641 RepID=A0AB32W1Z2_THECC|nr:PREDICTED: uncharacterized protein LOC108661181 [Theobroma cacao]
MEEEQRKRMDRMERAQEEMREQLAKMMELMTSLSKGKRVTEESAQSENPPDHDIGNQRDDPPYPPRFTPPHAQTSQRVHPQAMPSVYYNASPLMGHQSTHGQFGPYFGINPAEPIHVSNLDDPKEQKKLRKESSQTGENEKDQKKYDLLEERLHAIEGVDRFGTMDATELCLVPDTMKKKQSESFKEYAQKWRDTAAQVQPPLTDKEMTVLLINTLRAPFYERLIGNATKNFTNLVLSGEIIERAIKSGKIEGHEVALDEVNQVPRMFGELSIHMIKGEEPNEKIPMVYPVLPEEELSNWTATELPIIFKSSKMSLNNEHEDNLDNDLNIDFEMISNIDELKNEEEVDDYGLPPDLSRMLEQEEREILPYQELTEMINLGNGKEKKEVKIDTSLSSNERQKLEELLREYVDVFAWSYQDISGLNTDIVVHKLPLRSDYKPIKQKLRRMKLEMLLKIKEEIKMAPEDMKKTTFVTMWGTFCYKVMPFGLKNTGATYQRAMVALFHDIMHKEIKVYVDEMIVKSHRERDHTVNLKKLFERLRKFQLKLNLAKCTFGVTFRKLLGFILTCKCDPIFKLLRKRDPGEWNEECQIAFDKIKEYLTNPPVLVPPTAEKPHILYLTVNKNSMGCVLGQHNETRKKEQAIPSSILSEYDIVYVSQKSIKGSAIADFFADRANEDYESVSFDFLDDDLMAILHIKKDVPNEFNPWKMYFDGASNALGHEIGAVLVSPNEKYYPTIARLNFNCTNNIAEYEALVMGLKAAIEMKADVIDVYGDSALVICQMRGEWKTRDSKLVPYKKLVTELTKQFKEISFNHLPQEENQITDALATIATMFRIKEAADVRPFDLKVCEVSAHCLNVEEKVDGKPWYHDIM